MNISDATFNFGWRPLLHRQPTNYCHTSATAPPPTVSRRWGVIEESQPQVLIPWGVITPLQDPHTHRQEQHTLSLPIAPPTLLPSIRPQAVNRADTHSSECSHYTCQAWFTTSLIFDSKVSLYAA